MTNYQAINDAFTNEFVRALSIDLGVSIQTGMLMLVMIIVWTAIWKGFALWKSAKNNSPVWFIAILLVNTFGVLEIIYIFIFSKYTKSFSQEINEKPKRKTVSKKKLNPKKRK